ncbi:MAG: sulfotransferase [Rhodospirillales bacterium]|nr:MAG: sulfotransferase [Rhodospirillales bacterium]
MSGFDHVLGALIERFPRLWIGLGNLETRVLADEIEPVKIKAPIYVAGLARAGTTIALEILASHDELASHLYRDFPPVFTPWWWNWFVKRSRRGDLIASERAHKDGIMITADSPEAREEAIWMAFFPHAHDPTRSNVLERDIRNEPFERFYREHIRKLLAARNRRRYLSKGNYNVTRLGYLHELFPDARFIVPVRDPVWHVASLMKQHRLFCEGERGNQRAVDYMRRSGHFEFGLDMRPINCGDDQAVRGIQRMWNDGEEVRGWARYWALVYGYVADLLERDPALCEATMILRYEELCDRPRETITRMMEHCLLEVDDAVLTRFAERLRTPDYYRPNLSDVHLAAIAEEVDSVVARLRC